MSRLTMLRRAVVVLAALVLVLPLSVPFAAAQDGSRTLTDAFGREVTLDQPPLRVVGMSASINEMLIAIGVMPVGVSAGMDFPPQVEGLPTIGTSYQPDLEGLAALEPDLIIANAQLNEPIMDRLEAIAPTFAVLTLTPQDVPQNIRLLGELMWQDASAAYVALAYDNYLALAAELGAVHDGPTVVIIVGTLDVPNYGKSSTYLGAMVQTLGATNIADGKEDDGPFPGYSQLSIEAILDADPDYILTVTRGADTPMPESMLSDPIWSAMTAVQEGRAIELDNRLYVEAPGPRFVLGMTALYDLFYGEAE